MFNKLIAGFLNSKLFMFCIYFDLRKERFFELHRYFLRFCQDIVFINSYNIVKKKFSFFAKISD